MNIGEGRSDGWDLVDIGDDGVLCAAGWEYSKEWDDGTEESAKWEDSEGDEVATSTGGYDRDVEDGEESKEETDAGNENSASPTSVAELACSCDAMSDEEVQGERGHGAGGVIHRDPEGGEHARKMRGSARQEDLPDNEGADTTRSDRASNEKPLGTGQWVINGRTTGDLRKK